MNSNEINKLSKDTKEYFSVTKKNVPEITIFLNTNKFLIKTLRASKELTTIRLLTICEGKRMNHLGELLMNLTDDDYKKISRVVYIELVKIPCNNELSNISRKMECLQRLYELALKYPIETYEYDEDINQCKFVHNMKSKMFDKCIFNTIKKENKFVHNMKSKMFDKCIFNTIKKENKIVKKQNTKEKNDIKFLKNIKNIILPKMNLSEAVYRYFRYQIKNPITLLEHKAFQFPCGIAGLKIAEQDKVSLITSLCQGGKTFLVIPAMLVYLAIGYTPVIVVLDCAQKCQLVERLVPIFKELCDHLKTLNLFTQDDLNIFEDYIYYDSLNPLRKDDTNLEKALTGERRRCIISLKEHTHLKRINNLWTENSKLCVIFDEAQSTSKMEYNSVTENFVESESGHYHTESKIISERAEKKILVSATLQSILMVNETIMSDNIAYIDNYSDLDKCFYRGIINTTLVNLDTYEDKKEQNIPQSVLKVIEQLSTQPPISREDFRHKKIDKHPIHLLVKVYREIHKQQNMSQLISNSASKQIKNGNWAVMTFLGEGIRLKHKSLIGKTLTIQGHTSHIGNDDEHFFKAGTANISDIYQFIAEQGVDLFPRIMTISYDMSCEGMSFISHFDKPHNIHPTHGIFYLPNSMSCENIQQTMSRPFGKHGDDIKFTIFAKKENNEKFLLSYKIHDFQIRSLVAVSQNGNRVLCSEYLKNMEYMKNQYPKQYTPYLKRIEPTPLLVKNDNAKHEKEMMINGGNCLETLSEMDPESYKGVREHFKGEIVMKKKSDTKVNSEVVVEGNGKYYLIEPDNLATGTIQFSIVDETIKQLIDRKQFNKKVLRTDLLKWLLELNKLGMNNGQHINGNFDVGIIPKMSKVNSINTDGLLYWKEKNRVYLRLNL